MKAENYLVSVLMTSFNREVFIAEAIESVLGSSYKNFELIIIDDCSTDNTVAIANRYQNENPCIKLFVNDKNLGDYPNRNKAVTLAKGKYIMFCDSDDCFYEDTIQYCVGNMEKYPEAKIGMYCASESDQPFLLDSSEAITSHFFKKPFLTVGPGGTILDRDFFYSIMCYPEKYGPANDMYFNLKACSHSAVLLFPKLFLKYRIHEGQEKNNLYAYIHYNYCYLNDALNQLDMGLNEKQLKYLKNKNNRRFVTNLIKLFKKNKSIAEVKDLWNKANFSLTSMIKGVFH